MGTEVFLVFVGDERTVINGSYRVSACVVSIRYNVSNKFAFTQGICLLCTSEIRDLEITTNTLLKAIFLARN